MALAKGDAHQSQERLHEIHSGVKHRCMACHTAADGVSPGVAANACFRCHRAPEIRALLASADLNRAGCHGGHEQTLARVAEVGPRWSGGVSPKRSAAAAATAVLALFLFVGGFAQLYFGRRVERVARLAREDDADEKPKTPSLVVPSRRKAGSRQGTGGGQAQGQRQSGEMRRLRQLRQRLPDGGAGDRQTQVDRGRRGKLHQLPRLRGGLPVGRADHGALKARRRG